VRTPKDWKELVAGNPFPAEAKDDPSHLVVVFLKKAPAAGDVKALQEAIKGREVVRAKGRHAYAVYPDGIGRSKLTMALIEKKLGAAGTARNWNTIMKIGAMLCLALALIGGCGKGASPAEAGERAFNDPRISTSATNPFPCAFCHVVEPGSPAVVPGRLDAGYNLAGAAGRDGFWGARQISLLDAANVCLTRFMAGAPLAPEMPRAQQLLAYLEANGDGATTSPMTVVRTVTSLDGVQGDHVRGRDVYQRACGRCHGDPYTSDGRPPIFAHLVPEIPEHVQNRLGLETKHAVIGKVRQGMILGTGGVMPIYSAEALTDADLADLLAAMGL
jgi:thiosulfate dehydrogenase